MSTLEEGPPLREGGCGVALDIAGGEESGVSLPAVVPSTNHHPALLHPPHHQIIEGSRGDKIRYGPTGDRISSSISLVMRSNDLDPLHSIRADLYLYPVAFTRAS